MKRSIRSDRAPKPIGPYVQAIVAGKLVFASGQVALDPATGELVGGGVGDQTRQALRNLAAVMAAAGTSMEHAVKATVYLIEMDDFAEMNAVYAEFFEGVPPARTTVAVKALPRGARVEIDLVAAVP
ncbi:MAG TPA: Rid family detoxifying hydrolase [Candidatus Polarisedimenticolaceae bacterium]|nr:Rid family detoxifying hydrolase [Candidatus Polarisedimenticolaceae bacterium]